jgi:hypothetical protein
MVIIAGRLMLHKKCEELMLNQSNLMNMALSMKLR